MSTELFVVRHGETQAKTNVDVDGNPAPLVSGHLETHLTEKGKSDMQKVGEDYQNTKFDVCYISPLIRSEESAIAFLKGANQMGVELKTEPNLIEINYGPHEGVPASEVDKQKKEFFNSEEGKKVDGLGYKFEGVHPQFGEQESFREGADRYEVVLKKIAGENRDKKVLIISHSGVMRALQLCGKIESAGAQIGKDLKFGEVIKLESTGESLELIS